MTIRAFNEAARALVMWTALRERRRPPFERRQGTAGRRRPHGPADAGDQGRAHRLRLRQYGDGAAGAGRPRLHQGLGHGAVRARCPHSDDLRGHQRHPGPRPGRPQARQGRRPRGDGVLRRGAELRAKTAAATRDAQALCRAARRLRSAICSRRPCGSCSNAIGKPDNARRRRDRLHAPVRPGRARLHVGAHGRGGEGQARRRKARPGA